MVDKPDSIQMKIARIMEQIKRLPKGERNTALGYDFTGIDTITDVLRPLMSAESVSFTPSEVDHAVYLRERSGGRVSYHHIVKVSWWVGDGVGGGMKVTSMGEAIDTGDKGAAKAMTQARKTAYLSTFAMSTGDPEDDPDAHSAEETVQKAPPSGGVEELDFLIELSGGDREAVMNGLRALGFVSSAELTDPAKMSTAVDMARSIKANAQQADEAWEATSPQEEIETDKRKDPGDDY